MPQCIDLTRMPYEEQQHDREHQHSVKDVCAPLMRDHVPSMHALFRPVLDEAVDAACQDQYGRHVQHQQMLRPGHSWIPAPIGGLPIRAPAEYDRGQDKPHKEEDLHRESNRDDISTSLDIFRRLFRDDDGSNSLRNKGCHVAKDEYLGQPARPNQRMAIRLDESHDAPQRHVYTGCKQSWSDENEHQSCDIWSKCEFGALLNGSHPDYVPEEFNYELSAPCSARTLSVYSQYPPSTNGMKYHVFDLISWYECRNVMVEKTIAAMIAAGKDGS